MASSKHTRAERDDDRTWMAYIDAEVRAVCDAKAWGHQIRRKWSVREKPVSQSPVEDYEWKLVTWAKGRLPDAPPGDYEGEYNVLSFDKRTATFVLQHDTTHEGIMGPHWEVATFSEIRPVDVEGRPPVGWLRDHLIELTGRFKPNRFSRT